MFNELFAERFFEELVCIVKSAVDGDWLCNAGNRALTQDLIITVINIQQLFTINRQSTFQ